MSASTVSWQRQALAENGEMQMRGVTMQVVYERCCGLDIHKRSVVACIILPGCQESE